MSSLVSPFKNLSLNQTWKQASYLAFNSLHSRPILFIVHFCIPKFQKNSFDYDSLEPFNYEEDIVFAALNRPTSAIMFILVVAEQRGARSYCLLLRRR